MKINNILSVLLVAFMLAACASAVQTAAPTKTRMLAPTAIWTITSTPAVSPTPNPTLEPAIKFDEGVSQVPIGSYIFIEIRTYGICSTECNCAPGPVRPLYEIDSSGVLWTDLFDLDQMLTKPIVGFFGFGDWQDHLYGIDSLPYRIPPYDAAIVHSVDDKGIAVMEYFGKTFYIKPGQSWKNTGTEKREPPVGCRFDYGSTLTNYGLLSRTQIRFGDPTNHE
jgi:hypothetical protein